jgi:hypothetical protein
MSTRGKAMLANLLATILVDMNFEIRSLVMFGEDGFKIRVHGYRINVEYQFNYEIIFKFEVDGIDGNNMIEMKSLNPSSHIAIRDVAYSHFDKFQEICYRDAEDSYESVRVFYDKGK